jgi:hypothetical protein
MRKKDVEDTAVKAGMGLAPQVVIATGVAGKVAAVAAIAPTRSFSLERRTWKFAGCLPMSNGGAQGRLMCVTNVLDPQGLLCVIFDLDVIANSIADSSVGALIAS